ncbi:MAG TPA: nucleotide exchange factor GrpE [Spirochaetales bacterium]|nr:nucleotide exchange factor GrpE [Spirochaetales bacterium]
MRKPKPRFPFIISPYEMKKEGASGVGILQMLEKILNQNEETKEKISKLYKKLGFLESALDDFLDREPAGGEPSNREAGDKEMGNFFTRLIPILDSLDSIKRTVEESGQEEWRKGIAFFHEKLINNFVSFDFKPSAGIGMAFDPSLHESVGVDHQSDLIPGSITEIIQPGWLYKGEVLRFAKVIVAREKQ